MSASRHPRRAVLRLLREEKGSVTAEFAITVPAVLAVLGVVIGGLFLAAERVSLTSLAGEVARLEARGDDALAAARLAASGVSVKEVGRAHSEGVLCVTMRGTGSGGLLSAIGVSGRGCAALSAG